MRAQRRPAAEAAGASCGGEEEAGERREEGLGKRQTDMAADWGKIFTALGFTIHGKTKATRTSKLCCLKPLASHTHGPFVIEVFSQQGSKTKRTARNHHSGEKQLYRHCSGRIDGPHAWCARERRRRRVAPLHLSVRFTTSILFGAMNKHGLHRLVWTVASTAPSSLILFFTSISK